MEIGTVAKTINDFFTTNDGELCLNKGDIVQILEAVDRHWCIGCANGHRGKVPLNYLLAIDIPPLKNHHALFAAIADFPAQQVGDLSFRKGELIVGTEKVDENWWRGNIGNRSGMFPATYTWQLDLSLMKNKIGSKELNVMARVKMSLKAQLDEEIDLQQGEIVFVNEVIDNDWYRGSCGDRSGIFPSAYVTLLEEPSHLELNLLSQSFNNGSQTEHRENDFSELENLKLSGVSEPESKSTWSSELKLLKTDDVNDLLNDDYFKQNMPMMFSSNQLSVGSEIVSNVPSTSGTQLVELDIVPYGITLYPFYAQFDNELSFHEGEIVTLIRHVSKDWIEGKIDGKKGIFPSNYVNVIVDCESELHVADFSKNTQNECNSVGLDQDCHYLMPNSFAIVLFNFDAQMDSDLTVKEGEVVCVLNQVNQDWCEVKNYLGSKGLCPRNYLALYSKPNISGNDNNHRYSLTNEMVTGDTLFDLDNNRKELDKRRTFESHDFPHASKIGTIDDLISKNLETLQHAVVRSSGAGNRSSNGRDFIFSIAEKEVPIDNSETLAQNTLVVEDNTGNEIEGLKSVADCTNIDVTAGNLSKISTEDEPRTTKQLRTAPPVPAPPVFRRQPSDRLPHRPAPPVPLPGHKPVRRSIRKIHTSNGLATSQKIHRLGTLISVKEQQLEAIKKTKEEIEMKLYNNSVENEDSIEELKYKIKECDERMKFIEADLERLRGNEKVSSVQKWGKQDSYLQRQPPSNPSSEPEDEAHGECSQDVEISEEEIRKKNIEQRQNVISELVFTEKEYIRDLKITYETFNLHNPEFLESRGINVQVVFGNILDVMHIAEELLDKLQFAMKGKSDDEQCVGPCFVELAEKMKIVYGQYCMNHDEALALLERYDSDESIQRIFNKGLETLRYQIACFDMSSILIKPVQRILKYPLILNELIKCTDNGHKDKPELLTAVKTIMDVATYINEYKRRKDIVSKYLEDGNDTISRKMARLSLHSVAKKSSRLGVLFTSSLGLSSVTRDPLFQEYESLFRTLEKTIRTFMKDVEIFMTQMHDVVAAQCNISESINYFYQERNSEVGEFCKIQKLIDRQFWKEYENTVQRRTVTPLNSLLDLFKGPEILIQKCNDKFLDYVACSAKAEKNKDVRIVQEELLAAKNNYEALNGHLLDELPTLIKISVQLFLECLTAFVTARKLFSGKITKQYLSLMEQPLMKTAHTDALENFAVKHSLVVNQLARLACLGKNIKLETTVRKVSKSSPTPSRLSSSDSSIQGTLVQSNSQKAYLKSRYPAEILYCTTKPHTTTQPLELTVAEGHLVAVIKMQNPMGDNSVWFVDDGANQGFLPKSILRHHTASDTDATETDFDRAQSTPKLDSHSGRQATRSLNPPPPSYDDALGRPSPVPTRRVLSAIAAPINQQQAIEYDNNINLYEEIPDTGAHHRYSEIPDNTEQPAQQQFYYAMYNFDTQGPHTITLKSGQIVKVLQSQDLQGNSEWWLVADRFGNKGYVPANYLGKYE